MRSWKGLSSAAARDSTFPGGLPAYRVNKSYRGRGETESTGKIFSANNSSVGHGGGSPSPVGSAEDVSTLATSDGIGNGIGIGGEKISKFHSRGSFDYVDVIPPLSYHPRRRSSITISTTMTTPTGISSEIGNYTSSQYRSNALAKLESNSPITPTTPTTTTSTPISRTPSYTRHYHQQRQSLDGRGYKLSSPLDTPVHLVATPPSTNPGTNPGGGGGGAEMIPINRSASGGRKANRKPVPSYDEGLVPPTSASATLGGSSSPTPTPVSSNGLDRSNSAMSAREGGGGMYSNSRGNPSVSGGKGLLELPELNHKSSFGDGRPVHYLIPDMPPPQRD